MSKFFLELSIPKELIKNDYFFTKENKLLLLCPIKKLENRKSENDFKRKSVGSSNSTSLGFQNQSKFNTTNSFNDSKISKKSSKNISKNANNALDPNSFIPSIQANVNFDNQINPRFTSFNMSLNKIGVNNINNNPAFIFNPNIVNYQYMNYQNRVLLNPIALNNNTFNSQAQINKGPAFAAMPSISNIIAHNNHANNINLNHNHNNNYANNINSMSNLFPVNNSEYTNNIQKINQNTRGSNSKLPNATVTTIQSQEETDENFNYQDNDTRPTSENCYNRVSSYNHLSENNITNPLNLKKQQKNSNVNINSSSNSHNCVYNTNSSLSSSNMTMLLNPQSQSYFQTPQPPANFISNCIYPNMANITSTPQNVNANSNRADSFIQTPQNIQNMNININMNVNKINIQMNESYKRMSMYFLK